MKRIKEYPSTILVTFAIMASVLTILSAIAFSSMYSREKKASNQFKYCSTYTVMLRDNAGETQENDDYSISRAIKAYTELINNLSSLEFSNITMSDFNVRVGNINKNFGIDIIIRDSKEHRYSLSDGTGFSDNAELCETLIGESLLPYTYLDSNVRYIDIGDYPFMVVGILENETASRLDERAVIRWNSIPEKLKNTIYEYMAIRGDSIFEVDTDDEHDKALKEWEETLDTDNFIYEAIERTNGKGSIDWYYRFVRNTLFVIALFFSACSCFASSLIWLQGRQRELMVRRAFGYSALDIIKLLLRDFFPMMIFGSVLGFFTFIIFMKLNHTPVSFIGGGVSQLIVGVFCGIAFIAACSFIIPLLRLIKDNPADFFHR